MSRAATAASKKKPVAAKSSRKKTAPVRAEAAPPRAKGSPSGGKPAANFTDDPSFKKVRALALALPDTKLTLTWGSPHFRVGEKIFCGFGTDDGRPVLGMKLAMPHAQAVVKEARFWPAAYVGKHGWVSMDLSQRKSWDEVATLIRESYELIAPKASRAKMR